MPRDTTTGGADQPRKPLRPDTEIDGNATAQYRVTVGELRSFVERSERLIEEKKAIADQQAEVMASAKARGYDVKALRKLIALRAKDPQQISEEEAVLQLYCDALDM